MYTWSVYLHMDRFAICYVQYVISKTLYLIYSVCIYIYTNGYICVYIYFVVAFYHTNFSKLFSLIPFAVAQGRFPTHRGGVFATCPTRGWGNWTNNRFCRKCLAVFSGKFGTRNWGSWENLGKKFEVSKMTRVISTGLRALVKYSTIRSEEPITLFFWEANECEVVVFHHSI